MKTYSCFSIICLLILSTVQSYGQTPSDSSNSDCENKIQNQKRVMTSTINESRALSLAENSDLFKSTLQGEKIASYYIYYRWTEDINSCSVILKNVNVDFTIFSGNCGGANYVFKEDANLTKVTDVIFAGSWSNPYCPAISTSNTTLEKELKNVQEKIKNSENQNSILGSNSTSNSTMSLQEQLMKSKPYDVPPVFDPTPMEQSEKRQTMMIVVTSIAFSGTAIAMFFILHGIQFRK